MLSAQWSGVAAHFFFLFVVRLCPIWVIHSHQFDMALNITVLMSLLNACYGDGASQGRKLIQKYLLLQTLHHGW